MQYQKFNHALTEIQTVFYEQIKNTNAQNIDVVSKRALPWINECCKVTPHNSGMNPPPPWTPQTQS